MSDAMDETKVGPLAPEAEVWQADCDPLLVTLAAIVMANRNHRFQVTLTVSGILVTGVLVNRSVWAEELLAAYPGSAGLSDAWAASFAAEDAEYVDDGQPRKMAFLHIVEAQTFVGDRMIPDTKTNYWRGRISHVSGFSLGQLSREPEAQDPDQH